jgi:hypothetical protein
MTGRASNKQGRCRHWQFGLKQSERRFSAPTLRPISAVGRLRPSPQSGRGRRCASAIPRRDAPEVCIYLPPPWRAWGMPGARCTRGLVCTCIGRTHTSNNEYTGIARHSRTQWFYGLCRALPGDRACLPPSPADMSCLSPVGPTQLRELDASIGASGPHDFAVRSNISRQHAGDLSQVFRPALRSHRAQDAAASTASHPNVRDDHDTPLFSGRDGANL